MAFADTRPNPQGMLTPGMSEQPTAINLRKQVAPDGAFILDEYALLQTGRRAAALTEYA